jgi:hypothetical protein
METFDLDRMEVDAQLEVAMVIFAATSNALKDLGDAFWELRRKYGLELDILVQYVHPTKGQQLVNVQYDPDLHPPFAHLAGSLRGVIVFETSEGVYEVPTIGWPHLRKTDSSPKDSVWVSSTPQKTMSKLDRWLQSFVAATDFCLVDALH